ncbi:hypothetical protein G6M89_02110 [Natronolimnobius sp. AArcel1]|uniref:hypothetical protein n=1 Tax=Natronolimnobius sp. AArcel1 TaxID=1679093 RepID=UPI0013ECDF07|nr:hypothetical protein [Natronolimnobius sp. AArcel1]NGM67814.1 hypothetical protein [Natronolimnobius sp. AArcel1]
MDLTAVLVGIFGVVVSAGLIGWTYRDATRREVSRPILWATLSGGAFALGVGLYLFATVPTTGVIMTANTGIVLYTFEREVSSESDEAAEPGELPHK